MALGIDINANPIFNYVHNNIFNTMPRFQLFVICFVLLWTFCTSVWIVRINGGHTKWSKFEVPMRLSQENMQISKWNISSFIDILLILGLSLFKFFVLFKIKQCTFLEEVILSRIPFAEFRSSEFRFQTFHSLSRNIFEEIFFLTSKMNAIKKAKSFKRSSFIH